MVKIKVACFFWDTVYTRHSEVAVPHNDDKNGHYDNEAERNRTYYTDFRYWWIEGAMHLLPRTSQH